MRARIFAAGKYVLYPAFYLFCLFTCLYLTFPWDKLKERIEAEFAKSQEKKGARAWRLEIETLSGYWLTGIELQGAKIIMPPDDEEDDDKGRPAARGALSKVTSSARAKKAEKEAEEASEDGEDEDKPKAPTDSVVLIEDAHARVRMLPLLLGSVRLDFSATVFGGEIRGLIPFGGGDMNVEVENVDLARVAPLRDLVSVPIKGVANGKLDLSAEDGKWSKASGAFALTVSDMAIGDGKSKFRGLGVTMTPATVGTFEIVAKAEAGVFRFEKFGATGQEVELAGEGTLKLREPWDNSVLDLWLRFGFSEAYKHKDDRTKALFVDDGPWPALISQDKKLKRALRSDGLWGFNIKGKLSRLRYIPTKADSPKARSAAAAANDDDDDTSSSTTTVAKPKKKPKKATDDDDDGPSVGAAPVVRKPGVINRSPPMKVAPAVGREAPVDVPPPVEEPAIDQPAPEAPPTEMEEPAPAEPSEEQGAPQEAPQEAPPEEQPPPQ